MKLVECAHLFSELLAKDGNKLEKIPRPSKKIPPCICVRSIYCTYVTPGYLASQYPCSFDPCSRVNPPLESWGTAMPLPGLSSENFGQFITETRSGIQRMRVWSLRLCQPNRRRDMSNHCRSAVCTLCYLSTNPLVWQSGMSSHWHRDIFKFLFIRNL
jgi:hypothetical protein